MIYKSDTNIFLKLTLIGAQLGLVTYAVTTGAGWTFNILVTLAIITLVTALLIGLGGIKVYRPGIPTNWLFTVDVVLWIVYGAAGWWGLLALSILGDILLYSTDATAEEYTAYLEANEKK